MLSILKKQYLSSHNAFNYTHINRANFIFLLLYLRFSFCLHFFSFLISISAILPTIFFFSSGNSTSSAKQATHTNTNTNTVSVQSSATTSTASSTQNVDIDLTSTSTSTTSSTSTSKLNEDKKTSKVEVKSGKTMSDSGPNSTLLSAGVVGLNATQGKGFDPTEVRLFMI